MMMDMAHARMACMAQRCGRGRLPAVSDVFCCTASTRRNNSTITYNKTSNFVIEKDTKRLGKPCSTVSDSNCFCRAKRDCVMQHEQAFSITICVVSVSGIGTCTALATCV